MAAGVRHMRRRSRRAPGVASAAAAVDEGEEHHLNPFHFDAAASSSRLEIHRVVYCADQECCVASAVGGGGRRPVRRRWSIAMEALADHRCHPGQQAVLQRRGDWVHDLFDEMP
ncbi:hypothetical protein BRADI_3g43195v3 [Brachypodium distachyon]|uniref:Uncharacterized protein n=1 Tax=Brachypodium distachyon TaxID=15368 RepID=A0A0Q3I0Q7_BRADI|nr:hypothetical protein BRADI_3g43195v3 [Brachypodium distachyon]